MGYMKHNAIIVTSYDKTLCREAQREAKKIFPKGQITNMVVSPVNLYCSFFIGPDGSKEGWTDSEDGDINRKTFLDWVDTKAYDDGSNGLRYAEVVYAGDGGEVGISRHNTQA